MPHNLITLVCQECGCPFEVRPYRSEQARFCSASCFHVWLGSYLKKPLEDRFWTKVEKTDTCWLWTGGTQRFGHGYIGRGAHNGSHVLTHRLSWELHYGPIPDGMLVCHKCDVPACVRPDHLWLGTNTDNLKDMAAKGRSAHGEAHWHSRLTETNIHEIRTMHASGISNNAIASVFHVSIGTISDVVCGRTWRHVVTERNLSS